MMEGSQEIEIDDVCQAPAVLLLLYAFVHR